MALPTLVSASGSLGLCLLRPEMRVAGDELTCGVIADLEVTQEFLLQPVAAFHVHVSLLSKPFYFGFKEICIRLCDVLSHDIASGQI